MLVGGFFCWTGQEEGGEREVQLVAAQGNRKLSFQLDRLETEYSLHSLHC